MPDAAYEAAVAQLDADLAGLVERRRHAGPAPAVEVDPRELAIRLTELWDDLTVIEKRNLLRPLIHRVRILKPARQGKGVWRDRVDVIPAWGPAAG
ncbi:hypothetical protein CVS47_01769 [Microbacterium lemovicicum]|uniref:Uncharacterized protein n=2 Tax=Microbacterium lemovicicum TaxID=1072463 RepID=A0A3Q9IYG0_9MICO|nr:hypothetical protein CVS47_01769 [Microbacterium lemovicicum]